MSVGYMAREYIIHTLLITPLLHPIVNYNIFFYCFVFEVQMPLLGMKQKIYSGMKVCFFLLLIVAMDRKVVS